jgi:hypothetical protein
MSEVTNLTERRNQRREEATTDPFTSAEGREQAKVEKSVRQRVEAIRGLRALADLLETAAIPVPQIETTVWSLAGEDERAEVARIARTLPGRVEKDVNGTLFYLRYPLADGVTYQVITSRDEVCERRKIGTKIVQREVPVKTETVTEEQPVYEWDCAPVIEQAANPPDPDPEAIGAEHH